MSSQKMIYLTNLVTMFQFVLEKPGKCFESEKTRKIDAEEFKLVLKKPGICF